MLLEDYLEVRIKTEKCGDKTVIPAQTHRVRIGLNRKIWRRKRKIDFGDAEIAIEHWSEGNEAVVSIPQQTIPQPIDEDELVFRYRYRQKEEDWEMEVIQEVGGDEEFYRRHGDLRRDVAKLVGLCADLAILVPLLGERDARQLLDYGSLWRYTPYSVFSDMLFIVPSKRERLLLYHKNYGELISFLLNFPAKQLGEWHVILDPMPWLVTVQFKKGKIELVEKVEELVRQGKMDEARALVLSNAFWR